MTSNVAVTERKENEYVRQIIYTSQEKEEGAGGAVGWPTPDIGLHINQLFNMMFHSQQLNDKNDK